MSLRLQSLYACLSLVLLERVDAGKISDYSELFTQEIEDSPVPLVIFPKIKERTFLLMFDTGATPPVILDETLAKELGQPEDMGSVNGIPSQAYTIPEILCGKLTLPGKSVQGVDLSSFRALWGEAYLGAIGWGALVNSSLNIDYDKKQMQVFRGKLPGIEREHSVPLQVKNGIPFFEANLEGMSGLFLVDTGSSVNILLSETEFDRLVAAKTIEQSKLGGESVKLGGRQISRSGWFLKGELLGVSLKGFQVSTHDQNYGLIGRSFLLNFNSTFQHDPPSFLYTQRKNVIPPFSDQLMLGAILLYEHVQGRFSAIVFKLLPGGEGLLERSGFQVGDRITGFEGFQDQLSWRNVYAFLRLKAGMNIRITCERGAENRNVQVKLPQPPSVWNFDGHPEEHSSK